MKVQYGCTVLAESLMHIICRLIDKQNVLFIDTPFKFIKLDSVARQLPDLTLTGFHSLATFKVPLTALQIPLMGLKIPLTEFQMHLIGFTLACLDSHFPD